MAQYKLLINTLRSLPKTYPMLKSFVTVGDGWEHHVAGFAVVEFQKTDPTALCGQNVYWNRTKSDIYTKQNNIAYTAEVKCLNSTAKQKDTIPKLFGRFGDDVEKIYGALPNTDLMPDEYVSSATAFLTHADIERYYKKALDQATALKNLHADFGELSIVVDLDTKLDLKPEIEALDGLLYMMHTSVVKKVVKKQTDPTAKTIQ